MSGGIFLTHTVVSRVIKAMSKNMRRIIVACVS